MTDSGKNRVRFAPSPTGYLHVGSARTFIFNWLFARHTGGTMILRLDDTDVERNTQESVDSIFDGLRWLGLNWDEEYKQSERLEQHRQDAQKIFEKGLAYRDFTPAAAGERDRSGETWLFNKDMRELSREESDRRSAAGEPFALRFRVPRDTEEPIRFHDAVYGEQAKSTADIEDFALLRSDKMPTYHMASCADDADMRITHIIRGQDHLTNTFKHLLIFRALGAEPPQFAHLPLLVAPDGAKLSKRKHGPVVSVTTYADAGFLPQAFINFLCLLGWSPKDDREYMPLEEITKIFALENINRANAVINFKEPAATAEEMFDPKALWLNSQYIHNLEGDELAERLLPIVRGAGHDVDLEKMKQIAPLIRERIRLLRDVLTVADFFFVTQLPPYDKALLVPEKGDIILAERVLQEARNVLSTTEFRHQPLEEALRAKAKELGVKAGQMFQPIRVAVCGRRNAPPLFESLEVLGQLELLGPAIVLGRVDQALQLIADATPTTRDIDASVIEPLSPLSGELRAEVTRLDRRKFDALAGYIRRPETLVFGQELEWYSDASERVLGLLIRDIADGDFGGVVLGRDERRRFRAVTVSPFSESVGSARELLFGEIVSWSRRPDSDFAQGDTTGTPIDVFQPVAPPDRLNPAFLRLAAGEGFSPARKLIEAAMPYYDDVDGNFVEQFQTTAFDARFWELYLFSLFTEQRYVFDRSFQAPDLFCRRLGDDVFVEAVTVNPRRNEVGVITEPTVPTDADGLRKYYREYMPMKWGSALTRKLEKRYWELPHVHDKPLVLAVQVFHVPRAMTFLSHSISAYLYGIDTHALYDSAGRLEVTSTKRAVHKWGAKKIESGFFRLPGSENISAVITNPTATISKFNRMGWLAGVGSRSIGMICTGFCHNHDPNAALPVPFTFRVDDPRYTESWVQGTDVYHNPMAREPLDESFLPGAAHHRFENGIIRSRIPDFHPYSSTTIILQPRRIRDVTPAIR